MTTIFAVAGIAILPLIIIGIYTQSRVKSLFRRYSEQPVKKGMTGRLLARTMLNSAGLNDVVVEEVSSTLTDHYDPRQRVVRLSRSVARNASVAAVGIAAHEAAHAIQDGTDYPPLKMRNRVAPFVEKSGYLVLPLLFLAAVLGSMTLSVVFIDAALVLFLGIVVFYLVTLPVEFEASSRAMQYVADNKIVDAEELDGVRKVLRAAALTYLIAAALVVMQFLKLLGMPGRR